MSGQTRPTISALIITKDEEADLPECLASVVFCDEIIVVDSGSADRTADIARSCGARVVVRADWQGFGRQKQRALDLAVSDWVLSVDADERVTDASRIEIEAAVTRGAADGYDLPRLSQFLGRFMRFGGWYPDRAVRLARRLRCRFEPVPVHERLLVEGKIARLEHPLVHYSYRNFDDVLRKQRRNALEGAARYRADGKSGGLPTALFKAWFAFTRTYVLQFGFLDGRQGLVASVAKSQETFWRYLAVGWERP